jgi:hypothetical protein
LTHDGHPGRSRAIEITERTAGQKRNAEDTEVVAAHDVFCRPQLTADSSGRHLATIGQLKPHADARRKRRAGGDSLVAAKAT